MGKAILTNCRIVAGAVDITGMSNRIDVQATGEAKDATTFGSADANGVLWKENLAGLQSAALSVGGFYEAGTGTFVDDETWAQFGGIGPWSIIPPGVLADGSLAYLINAVRTSYALGGEVGEIMPYSAGAASSGPFTRGAVLLNPTTPRTVSGAGGVVQLGAVPAGKAMRAALHVTSIAGTTPTFTAILQSAALVGFGSPTTRATFTVVNGVAGTRTSELVASAAGPITDAFWRISYTITGTTPSYLVTATAGIG